MENEGTTFHANEYSWNKEVNMLYIESPAGVGYSYYIEEGDHNYTDYGVAQDNLKALLYFFVFKFPEYQTNDLYLSGESYAGIYVPTLAYAINDYNEAAKKAESNDQIFYLNLKGFMVGNGVTNWKYDTQQAFVEMAYWHGLYDIDMYNEIYANGCPKEFEYIGTGKDIDISDTCMSYFLDFRYMVDGINVYNIYGKCYGVEPDSSSKPELYDTQSDVGFVKVGNEIKKYKRYATVSDYTPWLNPNFGNKNATAHKKLRDLPECTFGQPIIDYLNRNDVKKALHISNNAEAWDLCNMFIAVTYDRNMTASQWVYEALQGKYRMLKFSGDNDGAVPTLGTMKWINELNWKVTKQWQPWFVNKQLAGYTEEREGGFTLLTIHNAGHMAPQDKREESYHGIFNWLFQRPI
jgi:serine carboxypeptidase-like clade 1